MALPRSVPRPWKQNRGPFRTQYLRRTCRTGEDLRELLTFTIDGSTAKDFDDAVSIEEMDGGWRLGVHIADVSHYVRPGSAIDAESYARGTSLYLPGYTVPMLPECLSNHLCSLMPGVDRLALSLLMDVREGRVVDHHLVKSVIHSHARLTYQAVNRMFDGGETDIAPDVRKALEAMPTLLINCAAGGGQGAASTLRSTSRSSC